MCYVKCHNKLVKDDEFRQSNNKIIIEIYSNGDLNIFFPLICAFPTLSNGLINCDRNVSVPWEHFKFVPLIVDFSACMLNDSE